MSDTYTDSMATLQAERLITESLREQIAAIQQRCENAEQRVAELERKLAAESIANTILNGLVKELKQRLAALEAGAVRFVQSNDLYVLLTDIQNGIDSPATCDMANALIRRLARIRDTTPQPAPVNTLQNGDVLSNVAAWNVALSDDEIAELANGKPLSSIRPENLAIGNMQLAPVQAVPEKITVSMATHSKYAEGWNDCVDAMLNAAPSPTASTVQAVLVEDGGHVWSGDRIKNTCAQCGNIYELADEVCKGSTSPTSNKVESSRGTDCGHGHVYPATTRARCGGPGICPLCSRDAANKPQVQWEGSPSSSGGAQS